MFKKRVRCRTHPPTLLFTDQIGILRDTMQHPHSLYLLHKGPSIISTEHHCVKTQRLILQFTAARPLRAMSCILTHKSCILTHMSCIGWCPLVSLYACVILRYSCINASGLASLMTATTLSYFHQMTDQEQ